MIKVSGEVVNGNKIGRLLGFPTANIVIDQNLDVVNGVYAAKIELDGQSYVGVANVGVKPSVNGDGTRVLEVNIFDFNRDIYGQIITVELGKFVRSEEKFSSFDDLKEHIRQDVERVKSLL